MHEWAAYIFLLDLLCSKEQFVRNTSQKVFVILLQMAKSESFIYF